MSAFLLRLAAMLACASVVSCADKPAPRYPGQAKYDAKDHTEVGWASADAPIVDVVVGTVKPTHYGGPTSSDRIVTVGGVPIYSTEHATVRRLVASGGAPVHIRKVDDVLDQYAVAFPDFGFQVVLIVGFGPTDGPAGSVKKRFLGNIFIPCQTKPDSFDGETYLPPQRPCLGPLRPGTPRAEVLASKWMLDRFPEGPKPEKAKGDLRIDTYQVAKGVLQLGYGNDKLAMIAFIAGRSWSLHEL